MNGLMLSPALGWPVGGAIAAAMAVLAVLCVVLHVRRRGSGDETVWACARRCALCLVTALMVLTPCVVTTTTSTAVNATDVVIAVDVTGSMAVQDARYGSDEAVSRLDAARRAVHDLTDMYPDASFAALRFGASGTLDVPLTPDELAIGTWADTLTTEATSVSAGSSLDAPLDQLLTTLRAMDEQHPDDAIVLYVITDGEQTSSRTRRTFSTLRGYVDDAFAIGVGSEEGGPVPTVSDGLDGQDDGGWVTDPETGEPGVSAMDAQTLADIADEMGGAYVAMDASHTMAQAMSQRASDQWRLGSGERERTRLTPVVWPLAIVAAALLVAEIGCWLATSRRLL